MSRNLYYDRIEATDGDLIVVLAHGLVRGSARIVCDDGVDPPESLSFGPVPTASVLEAAISWCVRSGYTVDRATLHVAAGGLRETWRARVSRVDQC